MIKFKSFLETSQSKYYFDLLPTNALRYFETRTRLHIARVNYAAKILYLYINNNMYVVSPNFLDNVKEHDKTKFYSELYPGYVWITAHCNLKVEYPSDEVKRIADEAWKKHYSLEDHHLEHYEDVNMMTKTNMLEMIADWCAMSMELKDSLQEWWKKQQKKYNFDEEHLEFITNNIESLLEYMSEDELESAFKNKIKSRIY